MRLSVKRWNVKKLKDWPRNKLNVRKLSRRDRLKKRQNVSSKREQNWSASRLKERRQRRQRQTGLSKRDLLRKRLNV